MFLKNLDIVPKRMGVNSKKTKKQQTTRCINVILEKNYKDKIDRKKDKLLETNGINKKRKITQTI